MSRTKQLLALLVLGLAELFSPATAHAVTGTAACGQVENAMLSQGVIIDCQYIELDAEPGQYMYFVSIITTKLTGVYTAGFIIAAILGVDVHVPTKTAGIGLNGGAQMIFEMPKVRACQRNFIDNDYQFIMCLARIGVSVD